MQRESNVNYHADPRTLHFVGVDSHGNRVYLNLATIARAEWSAVDGDLRLTWPGGEVQSFEGGAAEAIRTALDAMFMPPAEPMRPAKPMPSPGLPALRECPNRHCRSVAGPYDAESPDGDAVWVECFNCLMGGPGVYVVGKTLEEAEAEARRLWNELPRIFAGA